MQPLDPKIFDAPLTAAIERALSRMDGALSQGDAGLAGTIGAWTHSIAKGNRAAYYMHEMAFPALQFPRWLAEALDQPLDTRLHNDLVYATINGYYAIRLVDNAMDDYDGATLAPETDLLPGVAVFHSEFLRTFMAHFPGEDTFWQRFHTIWACSAQSSIADAAQSDHRLSDFLAVAALKVCAGLIPMTAVARKAGLAGVPQEWEDVFNLMGAWHQSYNDLCDLVRDRQRGIVTMIQVQARTRKAPTESDSQWLLREGLDRIADLMQGWMKDMQDKATSCGSPGLQAYLAYRAARFARHVDEMRAGLMALQSLTTAFGAEAS